MLLDEVAKYLADNGVGTVGADIFKSYSPDAPNAMLCVYEYGGSIPQDTFGNSTCSYAVWENPSIQIVCRSTDYQIARNKCEDAFRLLHGVSNVVLKPSSSASGTFYLRINALQSPFRMGVDENARNLVVCNFRVMKSLST